MRRKECERDEAFAWEVLKNSVYSTVSMVHPDGTPYATPVNIVGDEVYKTLYFHCAGAGERWEILKDGVRHGGVQRHADPQRLHHRLPQRHVQGPRRGGDRRG